MIAAVLVFIVIVFMVAYDFHKQKIEWIERHTKDLNKFDDF